MVRDIGIFLVMVFMLLMSFLYTVSSSEYVPWEKGDYAVYIDSFNKFTTIKTDDESDNWLHYTNFAGLGSIWVQTKSDSEQIFIRQDEFAKTQLFVDFQEPVGTITNIQIDPCNRGSVEIISKNVQLCVPAGDFNYVIQLALKTNCADGGITQIWFAPDAGFIKWESSNIAGSVITEMIQGKVGNNVYPQGLYVSTIFPEPSVTVNREPPEKPDITPVTVSVHMLVMNETGRDLTYTFNSGQFFEIKLLDSHGVVVSRWSRGKEFTQAIQTLTLKQGNTWNFGGEIELTTDDGETLPAGSYTLTIEMTSSHDPNTDHQSGSERLSATCPLNIVYAL